MASNGFWADAGTEPKRRYRFLLVWGSGQGTDIPQWVVKKVSKPSFQVSEITHKYLNYSFHYPGRVEWQDVSMTLVDPTTPSSTYQLVKMLTQSGYELPDRLMAAAKKQGGGDFFRTISKSEATNAVGRVMIQQYGANDVLVEEWVLNNAWLKDVKFGELAYESDEMVDIEITLKYDWATLTKTVETKPKGPAAVGAEDGIKVGLSTPRPPYNKAY